MSPERGSCTILALTSSLELFILVLAEQGPVTAYVLRQAGVSVGASKPALDRLVAQKLLLRAERERGRGKTHHAITAAGRKNAARWPEMLAHYLDRPPSDMESLFRVAAIAWAKGKKDEALDLLEAAAAAWAARAQSKRPRLPVTGSLGDVYRFLLEHGEFGRVKGEAGIIKVIGRRFRRTSRP